MLRRKTPQERLDRAVTKMIERDPNPTWYTFDKTPDSVSILSYQISRLLDDPQRLEIDIHCVVSRGKR